jgi:hypothetical protein
MKDIGQRMNHRAGWSRRPWCIALNLSATVFMIAAVSSCRRTSPSSAISTRQSLESMYAKPKEAAQADEQSCKDFVQGFYDWYVSREIVDEKLRRGPISNDVLQLRPQMLSQELRKLLQNDSDAQAKADDIVGLDFDPFLNSQDPSPKFIVESTSVNAGRCHAVVNGIRDEQKHEKIMPELAQTGSTWVFVNFQYHFIFNEWNRAVSKDDDLVHMLKKLADDRKKPVK